MLQKVGDIKLLNTKESQLEYFVLPLGKAKQISNFWTKGTKVSRNHYNGYITEKKFILYFDLRR